MANEDEGNIITDILDVLFFPFVWLFGENGGNGNGNGTTDTVDTVQTPDGPEATV